MSAADPAAPSAPVSHIAAIGGAYFGIRRATLGQANAESSSRRPPKTNN
jgi:hypothetical protein